jgi:hypothetical protein
MAPRLHTLDETAELLGGISVKTVRRLIAAGDLGSCDIAPSTSPGSLTRVSSDHIARFIRDRDRKAKRLRSA